MDYAIQYAKAIGPVRYAMDSHRLAEQTHPDYQTGGVAGFLGSQLHKLATDPDATGDIRGVAASILTSGRHDRLPILADAIDDAGHEAATWHDWRAIPELIELDRHLTNFLMTTGTTDYRHNRTTDPRSHAHEVALNQVTNEAKRSGKLPAWANKKTAGSSARINLRNIIRKALHRIRVNNGIIPYYLDDSDQLRRRAAEERGRDPAFADSLLDSAKWQRHRADVSAREYRYDTPESADAHNRRLYAPPAE